MLQSSAKIRTHLRACKQPHLSLQKRYTGLHDPLAIYIECEPLVEIECLDKSVKSHTPVKAPLLQEHDAGLLLYVDNASLKICGSMWYTSAAC